MAGLASLLSRRTTNPRAGGAAARRMHTLRKLKSMGGRAPYPMGQNPYESPIVAGTGGTGPPGGKHGGLLGYQGGGRTMNPRAAGAAAMLRNRPRPLRRNVNDVKIRYPSTLPTPPWGGKNGGYVGGYQIGGEVGVAPEEVAMASEIFARATPEQQAQITGGGGGPGMMDEEAAIGEALAMAMGGGGGPPMGGPPMNGAPPMGGLI